MYLNDVLWAESYCRILAHKQYIRQNCREYYKHYRLIKNCFMQGSEDYVHFAHIFLLIFYFVSMIKLLHLFLSSLTTIIGPKAKSKFSNVEKMHCNTPHNNAANSNLKDRSTHRETVGLCSFHIIPH